MRLRDWRWRLAEFYYDRVRRRWVGWDNPGLVFRWLDCCIPVEWRDRKLFVNITGGFVPFWSHNLTTGPDPVYVDSLATKKKLLKRYGLREAGDRSRGSYRTSTSGMGWKKPQYTATGVMGRWGT